MSQSDFEKKVGNIVTAVEWMSKLNGLKALEREVNTYKILLVRNDVFTMSGKEFCLYVADPGCVYIPVTRGVFRAWGNLYGGKFITAVDVVNNYGQGPYFIIPRKLMAKLMLAGYRMGIEESASARLSVWWDVCVKTSNRSIGYLQERFHEWVFEQRKAGYIFVSETTAFLRWMEEEFPQWENDEF